MAAMVRLAGIDVSKQTLDVHVTPSGESRTVKFTLTPAQLAYFDRAMKEVNGPGPVAVHVGNSSANLKSAGFVVA